MLGKRALFKNRSGAALALVAISVVGLLAVMALAIDMGMMYSSRSEAQRVADAAALAGAAAFIDPQYATASAALMPARTQAYQYALSNYVLGEMVDSSETNVTVDLNLRRVTVIINRRQIATWFARLVGIDTVAVSAKATAEAADAGAAKCVVPWAMQDRWFENGAAPLDTDRFNGITDPTNYPSDCRGTTGDCYKPATTMGDASASGYGRSTSDSGLDLVMKTQRPAQGGTDELAQPGPGEFMLWQMPEDPTLDSCAGGGGSTGSPSYIYKNSICSCNKNSIAIGDTLTAPNNTSRPAWETGNVVGPTQQGVDALLGPNPMTWQEFVNAGMPASHPQVVKVGLIAPLPPPPGQNWTASNMPPLVFTNFVLIFVDNYVMDRQNQQVEIRGKFLYPAPGEAGPNTGSLVKHLRLVE
jgi:Flp pilus assembly protein TadG